MREPLIRPLGCRFTDDHMAFADAVAEWAQRWQARASGSPQLAGGVDFPEDAWRGLAELGVLGLATPEGGGNALDVLAAVEALGTRLVPGPLPSTFLANQVLDEADRLAVSAGDLVVAASSDDLVPWGPVAQRHLLIDADDVWLARPVGDTVTVETLEESWGRTPLVRERRLTNAAPGIALYELVIAAYLVSCAHELLATVATYAAERVQFGASVGSFQAVAHPLADCYTSLLAATGLASIAATAHARHDEDLRLRATVARASAERAALNTAFAAHQVLGGVGFAVEGPAWRFTRRIRQLAILPPRPFEDRGAALSRADVT